MEELVTIADSMSSAEKRRARAHNRKIAYAELEEENRNKPIIELTEEEEKRAKAILRKVLKDAVPEYSLDEE